MHVDQVLSKLLRGVSAGLFVFVAIFVGLALVIGFVSGGPVDSVGIYLVSEYIGLGIGTAFCVAVPVGVLVGLFVFMGFNWTGWRVLLIVLAAVGMIPVGFIVTTVLAIIVLVWPTNDRDNANPETRQEMVEIAREWGMLAPFPPTAKDFKIKTEGNMFTRNFVGSFSDSPEVIKAWLDASSGVTKGKIEGRTIVLKMGGGANYGTVTVSADGTRVTFRVAWS